MSREHYTREFYERLRIGAARSAGAIAPLVLQLVPVRSMVDVGCGDGSWLAVFKNLGVQDILGIDGEYVDRDVLQISRDLFQEFNLAKPFNVSRRFDLAISLEVAEHLPADCAPMFVESLVRLAPVVLFSAAIPFQTGNNHINEQWSDRWASLFKDHDYIPIDCIRKRVWQDEAVEWWYAQNTLLFVHENILASDTSLKLEFEQTNLNQLCLVHPKQHLYLQERYSVAAASARESALVPAGVKQGLELLSVCVRNAVRRRVDLVTKFTRKLYGKTSARIS